MLHCNLVTRPETAAKLVYNVHRPEDPEEKIETEKVCLKECLCCERKGGGLTDGNGSLGGGAVPHRLSFSTEVW